MNGESPLKQHALTHKEGGSDALDAFLMRLKGYDYDASVHKFAAVDPTTKALLFKGAAVVISDHGDLSGLADDDHTQYYNQSRGDARYLRLVGGTLVGLLTLSGAPSVDLHASTKKYVDDNIGGGVTDHGALTGLADDDHTQYYNQARGDTRYVRRGKAICFVRLTSDQTVSDGVLTKIQFNTEDVDVGGNFNTTLNRFVAPEDDYYQIAAQLWIDGQIMNKLYKVKFRINNTYNNANVMSGVGHTIDTNPGDDATPRTFWPVKWLNAGDFVELCLMHHSGGSITVQGIEPYPGHKTWMSIIQLRG